MSAIAGTMDEAHYMCSRPDYEPITTAIDVSKFMMLTETRNRNNDACTVLSLYTNGIRNGWNMGQAFMNALPEEDYLRLTGTLIDPFHKDDKRSIQIAIDYLQFSKES